MKAWINLQRPDGEVVHIKVGRIVLSWCAGIGADNVHVQRFNW